MPLLRSDLRTVGALVLMVAALGLPWAARLESTSYLSPGFCVADSDGFLTCSGSNLHFVHETSTVVGHQSTARVFLVAAILLVLFAAGRRRWLLTASLVLATGVLISGLDLRGGQLVVVAAIALLLAGRTSLGQARTPASLQWPHASVRA